MTPTVLKIGGGLLGVPGAFEAVTSAVARMRGREPLVVVPGGGPFADAVREEDRARRVSPDAAHWMAILAMDQYGHLLADHIAGSVLVEEPGAIAGRLAAGEIAILAPSRWMRAADPLPHTWDVTSDSVAAYVAVALDARRLVLVKPAEVGVDGVDPTFHMIVPEGLDVSVVGWERFVAMSSDGAHRPGPA